MADNVNIIVQDTINDIVVNAAVVVETIDINVQAAVDVVDIVANPNNYVVNINRIIGEQVQSDWTQTDNQAPDYIKNKPTIPTATSDLTNDGEDGINPFITAADVTPQVNSDWDATSGVAEILNKPTIPAAVTKTSDLTNDGENGVDPFITAADVPASVTSVGLTMPSAFSVANSPITSAGTLAVTGAGVVSQYVRGDGSLANFPTSTGGGASLSFYLNGSVSQGTIGGVAFREMDRTPILGAGTDFTINANGYIQSFITDANVPNLLEIPAGNWNFETYFSASSGGGSPSFYVELYKWNGTTLSLIASNSASPRLISDGTNIEAYFSALAVPQTTLLATDRLAVRIYVTHSGRTITLHTEDNHLCQVITTFSTGITALNGLTTQVQSFATGTSGTDFGISSATATHTFNLPTASAANRGALSSTDWSTFNNKFTLPSLTSGSVLFSDGTTIAQKNASLFWDNTNNRLGIGTATPNNPLHVNGAGTVGGLVLSAGVLLGTSVQVNNLISNGSNVTIRNSGANTAITVFQSTANVLIQNGGTATDAGFRLDVNGTARFSNSVTIANFAGIVSGSNSINFETGRINFGGNASTFDTQYKFNFDDGGGNNTNTSGTTGRFQLSSRFAPTSGTCVYNTFLLNATINQTGTATGITRGLYINPTLTAAADFRAIENSVGKVCLNTTSGNTMIGTSTDAGFKLDVNGTARVSGTTTITPAALTGTDATIALDIAQTWNTTGTPSAIKLNVTDTASNGSSFLLDLRVANTQLFGVTKSGFIAFGSAFGSTGALIGTSAGTLNFYHKNTTAAAYGFDFRPNSGAITATSSESGLISLRQTFSPTSGTGIFNAINLSSNLIINQTGTATGITRGLFINPTLTAAADFRAIEVANGITILGASTTAKASLRIPSGTAPTSPVNGDIWFDGTDLKIRVAGVTRTIVLL